MSDRRLTTRSLALAVALTLTAVPLAAQQDTTKLRRTTSDKRIQVSKGEVELPPRVDTVFITRADTVREQFTRVDTVTVTAPPPPIPVRLRSSYYWGLFAGGTGPISTIDNVNTNGYHAGGLIGWEPRGAWYGARLTGSYTQIGREQGLPLALVGTGLPQMWQFSGDLKLHYPVGGWSPYVIGGLGFNSYTRLAMVSDFPGDNLDINPLDFVPTVDDLNNVSADDFTVCGADDNVNINDLGTGNNVNCYRLATDNWRTKFSWNFGLGTDFHIGSQDMFIEWRFNPIQAFGTHTWYMPISLGLRYF
jgi:opacity protein-like surface antigen